MAFNCSICYEPLAAAVEPNRGGPLSTDIIATRCGHLYHTICLQDWLRTEDNAGYAGCPTCRTVISLVDCMKLYPSRDDAEIEGRVSKMEEMKHKIRKLEVDLKKASTIAEIERIFRKLLEIELKSKSIELESAKEMLIEQRQRLRWVKSYWPVKVVKLTQEKEKIEVDLEKANTNAEKERIVQLKVELNSKSIELDIAKEMLIEQRQKWICQESYLIAKVSKIQVEKEKREVDLENAKWQREVDLEKAKRQIEVDLEKVKRQREVDLEKAKRQRKVDLENAERQREVDLENAKRRRKCDLKKAQRKHDEHIRQLIFFFALLICMFLAIIIMK